MKAIRSQLIALFAMLALAACNESKTPPAAGYLQALRSAPDAAFQSATTLRNFAFPEDHGAHPGFRNEWWYLTGHLEASTGERYGYQVTFFRVGTGAERSDSDGWEADAIFIGQAAVSDIGSQRFLHTEQSDREALGLAGAVEGKLDVHLGTWKLRADGESWKLDIPTQSFHLDLRLQPGTIVLQGEQGLSAKGPEKGQASYYYSMPRLASSGELCVEGVCQPVTGTSWFDREWSTAPLAEGLAGWDWLALHIDDGSDLMLYRLRTEAGEASAQSAGTYRTAGGELIRLEADDFSIREIAWWQSPETGARYPTQLEIQIGPPLDWRLDVRAAFAAQEHDTFFRYWEGAVRANSPQISGIGYLELVGY